MLGAAPGSPQARAAVSAVDQTVPLYRHLRVAGQLAAARELNDQWDGELAAQRAIDEGQRVQSTRVSFPGHAHRAGMLKESRWAVRGRAVAVGGSGD